MPTTYRAVEERLVRQIEALDAGPYAMGGTAKWHESRVPLSIIDEPSSLAHLAFSVWIDGAPVDGVHDIDQLMVVASVVVAFSFRLRASNQTADARLATDAAHDIVRAVLDDDFAPGVFLALVDGLAPAVADDGEWLFVTQTYEARFALDTTPPSAPAPPVAAMPASPHAPLTLLRSA